MEIDCQTESHGVLNSKSNLNDLANNLASNLVIEGKASIFQIKLINKSLIFLLKNPAC
jgi:hypothetical protein